jgi:uncharacterized protein (TIGR02757 family)
VPVTDLTRLYHTFNDPQWLRLDPLGIVDATLSPADFELVSFLVAGLSYGRFEQTRKSATALWQNLSSLGIEKNGSGLSSLLSASNQNFALEALEALGSWTHRLNLARDVAEILHCLSVTLKRHGSLCRTYQKCHHDSPRVQIEHFANELLEGKDSLPSQWRSTGPWKGTGAEWFVSSPKNGSSCKRLMMWLRWMIRSDHIDPGIWNSDLIVDDTLPNPRSSRLFWPVDTHVLNWAKKNKVLSLSASANWKSVEKITEHFRALHPDDPVQFDFAICHLGIVAHRKLEERAQH